jgi:HAD superfamily hydrolase (TIGR01509 family)
LRLSREEFLGYYHNLAADIYRNRVTLVQGVLDLVSQLSESGVTLAIASSSAAEWIHLSMERFGLSDRFLACVGADTVGGEGKPSPRVYLHAAELIGMPPGRCVAIEDSKNGIASAKDAGMFCVGLRTGRNDDQSFERADHEVDSLRRLSAGTLRDWFFSQGS